MFTERTQINEDAAIKLADDLCFAANVCFGKSHATTTLDSADDFTTRWGGSDSDTEIGDGMIAHEWHNVQPRGKGSPRGTLVVIDFGAFRVACFA